MSPYEKDPSEIGALWLNHGQKGEYLTGTINGEKVVCFRSKSTSPKAPTWTVLKSRPKGEVPERLPQEINNAPMPDDGEIPF